MQRGKKEMDCSKSASSFSEVVILAGTVVELVLLQENPTFGERYRPPRHHQEAEAETDSS